MCFKFRSRLGCESFRQKVSDSLSPGGNSAGSQVMARSRTHNADEAHHPMRHRRDRRLRRGVAGEGRWTPSRAATDQPAPRGDHPWGPPAWPTRATRGCSPRQSGGSRPPGVRGATRTRLLDDRRAAGTAEVPGVQAHKGRDKARATVRRITVEPAQLARRAAADVENLLTHARRARRRGQNKAEEDAKSGRKQRSCWPAAGG